MKNNTTNTEKTSSAEAHGDKLIFCEPLILKNKYGSDTLTVDYGITELFEIHFIEDGTGIHRLPGGDIPCSAGDVCIIPPGVAHAYFASGECDALTIRTMRLDIRDWFEGGRADPAADGYCYGVFNDDRPIAYATLNAKTRSTVGSLFDLISDELAERRGDWRDMIKGYLSNLFISIGRYVNCTIKDISFTHAKGWGTVSSAIAEIKENYRNCELTLATVADGLYVSQASLSRSFAKITGTQFSEYLKNYRLIKVCERLEAGNEPIERIARECGFRDMASFYKNFSAQTGLTPSEYRKAMRDGRRSDDEKTQSEERLLSDVSALLQAGKLKAALDVMREALDSGISAERIINDGLLAGMSVIGEKFKNNEVYVPEVLVAARVMNAGMEFLQPHLSASKENTIGRVCVGTVQGDLHDIGKNLVKIMVESKGIEVIDLGTDVPPEVFVSTAIDKHCDVICCSALLTTTVGAIADVVRVAKEKGVRDKVKIMIGGAPVTEDFAKSVGADVYTPDAASAADEALKIIREKMLN